MATAAFVDRHREPGVLEALWDAPQAALFVLFGRRRVGKSELLQRFCEGKRHVYFQAAHVSPRGNLRHFLQQASAGTGDDLLVRSDFTDWEAPLEYLARTAGRERLIVVLDEFPYLCEDDPALPSLLQRFWDQHGRHSRLLLVLCGSSIGFMEQQVLAERSPLFGRRSGQMELLPLSYHEAAGFLPRYAHEQHVGAYGILGGMPMYQLQFDDRVGIEANVRRSILPPHTFLHDEPEYLLRMELRDPGVYQSVLEAVAGGLTKHNEIAARVGKPPSSASPYLATLEQLRLLQRVVPVTARAAAKRSVGRYFVSDPFLRFWYRFVLPNRSALEMGHGDRVWAQCVAPQLNEFLGPSFESICREYLRRHGEEIGAVPAGEVGRFWSRDVEIDVLCRTIDGTHLCGDCKWTRRLVGESDLQDLKAKAAALPEQWRTGLRYVLFSRRGFTDALRLRADEEGIALVGLEELYGA